MAKPGVWFASAFDSALVLRAGVLFGQEEGAVTLTARVTDTSGGIDLSRLQFE